MARVMRRFRRAAFQGHWVVYLVVGFCFCGGLFAGGWAANGLERETAGELHEYLDHLFLNAYHADFNARETFLEVAYNNLLFIALIFLAGITVIGIPVMLALVAARGFALGFAMWFVIGEMGGSGVLLVLAAIVPQNLLLVPAVLFAAVLAVSFALLLVRRGFDPEVGVWSNFLRYAAMQLGAAGVLVSAAFVEAYVTPRLVGLLMSLPG